MHYLTLHQILFHSLAFECTIFSRHTHTHIKNITKSHNYYSLQLINSTQNYRLHNTNRYTPLNCNG